MIQHNSAHAKVLLAAIVASSGVIAIIGGFAGAALGVDYANNDEIANETVPVDEDTEAVIANVLNSSDPVDVHIFENGSEVATGTIDGGEDETDRFEFEDINATAYDEYRVTLTATADNTTVEEYNIGRLQLQTDAGAGFLPGGQTTQMGLLSLVVIIVIGAGVAYNSGRSDQIIRR